MNFFKVPKENMSKDEIDELIHLYKIAQKNQYKDKHEIAHQLLREFHSRQQNNGISDRRLNEIFKMSFPALNRNEKDYVNILTKNLMLKS